MYSTNDSSEQYYIREAHSRNANFFPVEFDLTGAIAGYQPCPLKPPLEYSIWGPIIRDYYVIYYTTKGTGTITINGIEYTLNDSQLFITFPGVVISEYTENPNPLEYHWLHLKSSQLARLFRRIGISETQPFYKGTIPSSIIPVFEGLATLTPSNEPIALFERICLVSQLFRLLLENSDLKPDENNHALNSNEYISQALRYFDLGYNNISVGEVADALGFTHAYFSTLFKKHMQMSPQEYLIRLRMKKACEFLVVPNATIASVASSVGYDQFAFSRLFKKTMGISPTDYQKNNK